MKKASNRYPCTNYLNKCVLCKADVWLYNTEHHYEDMHPEAEKPELDPEEVKFMSKKKYKTFKEINVIDLIFLFYRDEKYQ